MRQKGISMSTLVHYIHENGDRTFLESPFNEVDGLILAHGAIFDYSTTTEYDSFTFAEISHEEQIHEMIEKSEDKKNDFQLVKAMRESERFSSIEIVDYESIISTELRKNFGAVAYKLPTEEGVVAFKGSDTSFLSWEENLNLAFQEPIPSLKSAIQFLKRVLENSRDSQYVLGHSKGGYLATAASLQMPIHLQKQILEVFNYDGPGIFQIKDQKKLLDQFQPEINKYITQSSFIGRMFEKSNQFKVIDSTASGFSEHRPHTWKIEGNSLKYLTKTSFLSNRIGNVFNHFIDRLDDEEASNVVETLFNVLNESKFSSFADFKNINLEKIKSVYHQRGVLDKDMFHSILKLVKLVAIAFSIDLHENLSAKSISKKEEIHSYVTEYKSQLSNFLR